ncbi:plasma-membrane choline transporter family protein [Actinidia rufa]|uniref:Plasma-membrane choline transporter family protein n=1 Tax=Actinidia rufa TaxID=165716 RepID=A0A7J0GXB8_9ERIC|nr:plasma-membrane choline transporter family protein [Actinidia rufa]
MRGSLGAVIGRYPSSDGSAQMGGIIRHNRKCRDVVFLVFFIAFWVGMIVNSSFGFNKGKPIERTTYFVVFKSFHTPNGLNYGLDYKGNVCGDRHANADLHELELRYWLNPNQVYQSGLKNSQFKLDNARSICLMDCPVPSEDSLNWVCDYPEGEVHLSTSDWIDRNYDYFADLTPELRNNSLQLQGPCYPVIFPSVNVYWSCQFIAHASNINPFTSPSIHGSAVLKLDGLETVPSPPSLELKHLRAVAVLMTAVMIVSILSSIAIVRRILMATSVLKVAAKVIGEVRALIIFPVIPYLILAIFYMFWLSAALYLFSSGQVLENECNSNCCAYELGLKRVSCDRCCGYTIHYTNHISAAILFHLFGCYWATQFFIACSSTVIAGSVASYYWARGETSPEIPFLPVFSSMRRLMRYGLGSVALGSLIVSFVESIRFILEAIRRKLKAANTVPDSQIGRVSFNSSQLFRRCIEWTIKSVNRNAYIMIAITGKGFFKASEMATELIISNILRIGKVNVIGDVILFLGKLCVSLSSAVFAFLMLNTHKYNSAPQQDLLPPIPCAGMLGIWICCGYSFLFCCGDVSSAHRVLTDSVDQMPKQSQTHNAYLPWLRGRSSYSSAGFGSGGGGQLEDGGSGGGCPEAVVVEEDLVPEAELATVMVVAPAVEARVAEVAPVVVVVVATAMVAVADLVVVVVAVATVAVVAIQRMTVYPPYSSGGGGGGTSGYQGSGMPMHPPYFGPPLPGFGPINPPFDCGCPIGGRSLRPDYGVGASSDGSSTGAHLMPISSDCSKAVKEDREGHEAHNHGSLEFAKKASEHTPPDMDALASNNHGLFEYAKKDKEPISSPMDWLRSDRR